MRGYFDGDGSFYTYRNDDSKIDSLAMNVCGTLSFLSVYRQILIENKCVSGNTKNIYKVGNIYQLAYKGNRQVTKIRDFLYYGSNANNRLDRKYNIVFDQKFINMPDSFRYKPVVGTEISTSKEIYFQSISHTKDAGFEPKLVSRCCLGTRKTHKGFAWKYNI